MNYTKRIIQIFTSLLMVVLLAVVLISGGATAQTLSVYPTDTTLTFVAMPSVPFHAYLTPFTDPTFHTTVTRIADQQAMGVNNQFIRHGYAKRSPWNADDSLIMLVYTGIYNAPILDGNTYTILRWVQMPNEPRWSNTHPNKIYGVSGNSFISVDATTGAITTIRTFGDYTGLSIGSGEGNLSSDDKYVVLSGKKSSKDYALVYDIPNNAIVADKMLGDGSLDYDWITISQSGNYVVMSGEATGSDSGIFVYDRNLNFLRKIDIDGEHGDLGYTPSGAEVYVQWNSQIHGTVALPLDGSPRIDVMARNWIGGHISCRNNKRPGWCYLSEAHGTTTYPGSNEVYAIKLDGSGTVERFAHMHNSPEPSYEAQPQAVPSRDGTKVMFASDWGSGSSAPVYSYVAEMPRPISSTTPPPSSSTTPQTSTPIGASPTATPLIPPAVIDNRLVNGGFEIDANNDGRADGWRASSRVTRNNAIVHSGNNAMRIFATNNASYNISQTINNLTAGNTYAFTGWVSIPPTKDTFTFKIEIKWKDVSNHTIKTESIKTYTTPTSGWDLARPI